MKTSRFRYFGSWLFNLFIRLTLWTPIKDNLSGFLAFKREILDRLPGRDIFYGYGGLFVSDCSITPAGPDWSSRKCPWSMSSAWAEKARRISVAN